MEKESIVVDANILISALIGGESRKILFNEAYAFITTEFTISEVEKYIPLIARKSGVSEDEILFALRLLPLAIFDRTMYNRFILMARELIEHIDIKDADILALALATSCKLWSHDQHFDGIKQIKLLNTKDLL